MDERMVVPRAQSFGPITLAWVSLGLLLLFLFTSTGFLGGYYLGKTKTNELQVLADRYPFVSFKDRNGGFLRDKDRMVLFGEILGMSDDKKQITIQAQGRPFLVALTPKTSLIEGSRPLDAAQTGNWVAVNMLYSKPFVADHIYFSQ